jgi:regulator of protease activity HflC (stomatin/prohibitin superfamily)
MEWLILLGVFFLFVRFTIVKEGTAQALMKAGAFYKIIFQWENHWMDVEWNIWRKKEKKKRKESKLYGQILGGLYVYLWPFYKIYKYPLRWTDLRRVEEVGEKIEKTQFHDEELKHVMLKPAVYWTKIFKVETLPPERIPLDIEILITMRILNPFLFLFIAPPTPLEDVLARIDALMRARVSMLTVDEFIALKGKSETLWEGGEGIVGLKDEKLIKKTLPKWGLQIAKQGIDIKSIGLPPEYQKAGAAKKEQEMRAAGRAEEIMGTVILAVTRAEGRKEEEVQAEFRADPQVFYQKHQPIVDNTMTKLSMEQRSYLRIETPGATGMEGAFLNLIGAWKRIPGGESEQEPKKEEVNAEKPLSPETERVMKSAREALETLKKQGRRHKKKKK